MSETPTGQSGLHCVHGKCQGVPHSQFLCHPGCSFRMVVVDELEMLRRSMSDHRHPGGYRPTGGPGKPPANVANMKSSVQPPNSAPAITQAQFNDAIAAEKQENERLMTLLREVLRDGILPPVLRGRVWDAVTSR